MKPPQNARYSTIHRRYFLQIRQYAPKWLATIDLTDMFFGIPLHPESREITTFAWQNKKYRFKRLPQGYLNSPIIAHATLMTTLETLPEVKGKILSYVDDVLIIAQLKEDATDIKNFSPAFKR